MTDVHHVRSQHTLVVLVDNEPGVLNRVASMFRRRAFNIDSLTVGRTHNPEVSRMTIVVNDVPVKAQRIAVNLEKLVNVIDVEIISDIPSIIRDLVLIKVRANNADTRNKVTTICESFPARIVDIGPEVIIVEMVGAVDQVEALIEEFDTMEIVEMIRTGAVAMGRGTRIQDKQRQRIMPAKSNGHI